MVNTVTLNPAIDKVLFLERMEKNITNRVQSSRETIGGKGTHVSINLKLLGMDSRAFGICHGATGQRITAHLRSHGLDLRFLHREGADSRTNYLLIEAGGDCTLVAERGVPLASPDLAELFRLMADTLCDGDYLVLSGDGSNCDPSVYKQLLEQLSPKGLQVFLDTSGEALADCVGAGPFLIKPNLDELAFLCGRPVGSDSADVVDAIDSLERFRIPVVAVSMGGDGSVVRTTEGIHHAASPPVGVVNTIGCGDCYLAGLIYGFANGLSIEETLRVATGAAAATAESPGSVGFDPRRARELSALTRIKRLR